TIKAITDVAVTRRLNRREFLQSAAAAGVSTAFATSLWPTIAKAQAGQRGGSLKLGADGGTSTDTLNPLTLLGADHPQNVAFAVYDTLMEIDHEGTPQPSLAESVEGSPDGTWAIRLRKGVEFHDGKPCTASDVVWSLQQHKREDNKNAEGAQIVGNMAEIKADGPDLVVIKQSEVNFDLPAHLSSFGLLIGKEGNEDWNAGVGTGPYTMGAYEPGVRFTGERFGNFYRDDQGYFDSVEILNVADAAARASGLLSGSLDAIGSPDISTATRLARVRGYELVSVAGTQHYTTDMRTDTGPLTDPNVRNAVKWAFKRQEIVDNVLGGFATIGNDIPLSPAQKFYNNQLPQREYDPDQVAYYLREAGLTSVDLTFHTSDGAFSGAVDLGALMAESMRPLGINVTVAREPADGYWSNVWMTQPWTASYYAGRPTADWMLTSQYASTSQWDATYFKNAEFDALLAKARTEQDDAAREALYFEAQKLLWEKGGVAVLAFVNILIGASESLGHGPVGISRRLDDARLARRWWSKG
ncbi:MAG: ABC transporter substrate-binding protein, partial [Pseudomonadota bacterium]